jgi:hypothetical protein
LARRSWIVMALTALVSTTLAACQPPPSAPAVTVDVETVGTAAEDAARGIRYRDEALFDRTLSAAMEEGRPTIDVRVDGAADVNALPVRLERWFSTIRQTGGRVRAQPLPEAGMPRPVVTDVPVRLVDTRPDPAPFVTARDYNATILYARRDGAIAHVVFERRQALR